MGRFATRSLSISLSLMFSHSTILGESALVSQTKQGLTVASLDNRGGGRPRSQHGRDQRVCEVGRAVGVVKSSAEHWIDFHHVQRRQAASRRNDFGHVSGLGQRQAAQHARAGAPRRALPNRFHFLQRGPLECRRSPAGKVGTVPYSPRGPAGLRPSSFSEKVLGRGPFCPSHFQSQFFCDLTGVTHELKKKRRRLPST